MNTIFGHNANNKQHLLAACVIALGTVSSAAAQAGCSPLGGTVSTWKSGSGNWSLGTKWTGGEPDGPTDSACIVSAGTMATLNVNARIQDLQLGSGDALDIGNNHTLTMFGTQLLNAGTLQLSAVASNATLALSGNILLSGGGNVELGTTGAGKARIQSVAGGGYTLTNADNNISGTGLIGGNGLNLVNQAPGIVDANTLGGTLSVGGTGTFTNSGLFEASNGGTLSLTSAVSNTGTFDATGGGTISIANAIANAGGVIKADGATVNISGQIDGGTLQTVNGGVMQTVVGGKATLNDVTIALGSTYQTVAGASANTVTKLEGTIDNQGTILATGGSSRNAQIALLGNVMLEGGGAVQLGTTGAGSANLFSATGTNSLLNVDNVIEGTGSLKVLAGIDNGGTVDANVSGKTLTVFTDNLTNTGVLEATGGGVLSIANAFANAGQLVTASGGSISIAHSGFTNHGTVTIAQGTKFAAASTYGNSGVTHVDGTLTSLTVTNTAAGSIGGTGSLTGNLMNYGTTSPGDPGAVGILTVDRNFTQASGGALQIGIAGNGDNSQLDVGGTTTLAGKLAVELLGGFTFAEGDSFDVIHSDLFSDDFQSLSIDGQGCIAAGAGNWDCASLGSDLYLAEEFLGDGDQLWLAVKSSARKVPEPDAIALLATGLLAAAGLARRRRKRTS